MPLASVTPAKPHVAGRAALVAPVTQASGTALSLGRARVVASLREAYLNVDTRTLGIMRIVFALVLLADLARRLPGLATFYANSGLIPNHTVLWRPPSARIFSLFFLSSFPEESAVLFAVCFLCFFCFLVGYRTRLFHLLSFVMTTSLHNRINLAENHGGVAIAVLMTWTMFLPMGRRFSFDAVRASLRSRRDETPGQLAAGLPVADDRPATSLAVLGLLLQIAAIYWFNFLHKSGATWREGTAVYYVLHQTRIVTALGLWVREHASLDTLRLLTHGTLVVESLAPVLVLTPLFWRSTRPLAGLLLLGLHAGIAAMINLGIFSAAMIAFMPFLLLTPSQWRALVRWVPARGRARLVYYDADCGVCFLIVRVLARLDVHRRLRWLSNRELPQPEAGRPFDETNATIVVIDQTRARRFTKAQAFAEIFAALPFGRLWSWPLRLPLIRAVADRVYDRVARERFRLSLVFGLAGCAVRSSSWDASVRQPALPPATLALWLRERLPEVRELLVVLTLVVMGAEVSVANAGVPAWLRFERRPTWMVASIMYPHVFQSWGLFSPDAPTFDQMVYVDAVTADGRHVDPYNQVASRVWDLPVGDLPARLGQDSFWCDYTLRIPEARDFHQALSEWIRHYPERTGNYQDAIVSFEAFALKQDNPPPGQTRPSNVRRERFLSWP